MSAKSKSKQEEALQFLDDLDSLSPAAAAAPPPGKGKATSAQPSVNVGEAEALAFIDEITQKSLEPTKSTTAHIERPLSRAGTPTLRKSTERVRVGSTGAQSRSEAPAPSPNGSKLKGEQSQQPHQQAGAQGGWGWGSVWTTASAAIQQAKTVVDEQVKNLPQTEQARKWGGVAMEYAKNAQLDKIGQDFKRVGLSTLTDILNVVAPPISEHEVIQVWLSHDMVGYEGIESLVYRALARIMEQVQGGDLIVNRGVESKPKESASDGTRDLNAIEGYDAAIKLAQAYLDELISNNSKPVIESASAIHSPVTTSQVYLRVQPYMSSFTLPSKSAGTESADVASPSNQSNLLFVLYLSDPAHNLVHSTVTQAIPASWLPFWDEYDWVEDLVAEALRVGVEVIGQEYVVARMGWGKDKGSAAVPTVQEPINEKQEEAST